MNEVVPGKKIQTIHIFGYLKKKHCKKMVPFYVIHTNWFPFIKKAYRKLEKSYIIAI